MPKKPAVVTGPHPGGGWQNKIRGQPARLEHRSQLRLRSSSEGPRDGWRSSARKTEHKIQNQNGQIKQRNSYGNDPNPPKG